MALNELQSKLRSIRQEKGLTLGQVSTYSGLDISTISLYETGKRDPKKENITKLAKGLRVDPIILYQAAGILPDDFSVESMTLAPAQLTIPIIGRIYAGAPDGVKEDFQGEIGIDQKIVDKYGIENLMALRIDGESMNKVAHNNSIAILHKTQDFNNGDILAVIINGDSGTIKHVYKYPDHIRFEPDSFDDKFKPFEYSTKDIDSENPPIVIVGKYLYSISGEF
jgi:repressor LexA